MKQIKLITKLIAVLTIFILASCSQEDDTTEEVVTELESAEDIGATLSEDLLPIVDDADELAEKASDGKCRLCA